MFRIGKPTEGVRLIQWTKELPRASEADPLGLELRASARISNELLYCITSITPRARYYAFFPWALHDYNTRERLTKTDRGRIKGVLSRERAMVLGAILHHDGAACENGALGGSKEAIKLTKSRARSYDLSAWKHLNNSQGQFGAAYKGSLINLGVFETDNIEVHDDVSADTDELDETTQAIEVRELSALGRRLADAFGRSVQRTAYVSQGLTTKDKIAANILEEFGSRAGLCEITEKAPKDREILREVFFARCPELGRGSHLRRRMSLILFLECIARTREAGLAFDDRTLSDICYFEAIVIDRNDTKTLTHIALPACLADIQQRWRVFFTQGYLAVALQSLLVALVRQIRDKPAGVMRSQVIPALNPPSLPIRFKEILGQELPGDFFEMTARETLALCGVAGESEDDLLPATASFSERRLEGLLVDDEEANEAAGVVLAAMLLYQTVLRYKRRSPTQFHNWYAQQIHNDYADVALPGVIRFLEAELGKAWLDRTNHEILDRLIWRFVVRQHQTMSYERGFGGVAPLFHVDGNRIVATEMDYTDPRAKNPRFWPAMQILADLKLTIFVDKAYELTSDGEAWLASELASVSST
jgi:hypothetical protein